MKHIKKQSDQTKQHIVLFEYEPKGKQKIRHNGYISVQNNEAKLQ